MADQDDISPWARDDWSSSDTPAFESPTAPVDPTELDAQAQRHIATDVPADPLPSPQRPHGSQVWIAAAFGAVLLIGGVVALVRNDSADRGASADVSPEPTDGLDVADDDHRDRRRADLLER